MAQLRYLGTSVALAAQADPQLPYEVADDYLRVAMLTLMAWAWARIERAAPAGDTRWAAPAAAFRRWLLPEFDMRLGLVKRGRCIEGPMLNQQLRDLLPTPLLVIGRLFKRGVGGVAWPDGSLGSLGSPASLEGHLLTTRPHGDLDPVFLLQTQDAKRDLIG